MNKHNFGHSTISVNNQLHVVDGLATIIDFKDGTQPEVTIDLTPTFEGQLTSVKRRFVKDSPTSLLIEDEIEISEETERITWQFMTLVDVEIVKGGALLVQDGKTLKIDNLSHPELTFSVISLDPAPLELDIKIKDLNLLPFSLQTL